MWPIHSDFWDTTFQAYFLTTIFASYIKSFDLNFIAFKILLETCTLQTFWSYLIRYINIKWIQRVEYCWRYRADTIPSTDGRTDGQTGGQRETSIPPFQLRWAGLWQCQDARQHGQFLIPDNSTFLLCFLSSVNTLASTGKIPPAKINNSYTEIKEPVTSIWWRHHEMIKLVRCFAAMEYRGPFWYKDRHSRYGIPKTLIRRRL